ncbi:hypothetical protein NC653_005402 [Populus alba x Populus x berolinensis]|uniref:Uncharacterized protein n=1 Tax=Populus alba x Populus x berolinensis TaxID=444605 RepID=A0AAD6RBV2_9ROSI|nr:hypothetical protein NC653_005402 [Populus alba x Populus x berolinensis]
MRKANHLPRVTIKLPISCPDNHHHKAAPAAAIHLHLKASLRKNGKPVPKTPLPRHSIKELGFIPDIVTAVGYATLPCVSRELAESCSHFVTAIVMQDDIIHRLSAASLARLRNEILQTDWMSVVEKEDWKSVIGLVTNAKQVISFVQDVAQKFDYARFGSKKTSSGYLHEWATGHGVGSNLWSWNSRTPSIEQGYQKPLSLNQAVFGGVVAIFGVGLCEKRGFGGCLGAVKCEH